MALRHLAASLVATLALANALPASAAPPSKPPVAGKAIPKEAVKLEGRALALAREKKYDEAVPLVEKSLGLLERTFGKDHVELGITLSFLSQLEALRGNIGRAEMHADRAIDLLSREPIASAEDLAAALFTRWQFHDFRKQYDQEIELRRRAIQVLEQAQGLESKSANREVFELAKRLIELGRYNQAKPFFERYLDVMVRSLGPDVPDLLDPLIFFGRSELYAGRYDNAEALLSRALEIAKKGGNGNRDLVLTLNLLAEVAHLRGDYVKAESQHEQVLATIEKSTNFSPSELGIAVGNWAAVRVNRGDLKGALPLLRRALELQEKELGKDDPNLVAPLNNLGEALLRAGRMDEAAGYLERAANIRVEAVGANHPSFIPQLLNIAALRVANGRLDGAEKLFTHALSVQEKTLGLDHPLAFRILQGFGVLQQRRGQYEQAEALHRRAVDVVEKAFGPTHADLVAPLLSIASLLDRRGDHAGARQALARAGDLAERQTVRILAGGSEQQKLGWLSTIEPLWSMTLAHHLRWEPNDPQVTRLALEATLRRKGRALDAVADSLSALRQRLSPEDQQIFDKLREMQRQLAAAAIRGPGNQELQVWRSSLEALETEVARLEDTLSDRSAAYQVDHEPATVDSIQRSLPKDAVYIDFVRRPVPTGLGPTSTDRMQYAVYVLGATGDPRAIELEDATKIDDLVVELRQALADPQRSDVKKLSRSLDELVLRPVRPLLGSSRRIILSPDGALNFVPFEALVDDQGHYLIEEFSLSYVTSGRDLLRWSLHVPSRTGPVVFASPSFGEFVRTAGSPSASSAGPRVFDAPDIERIRFPPLPGASQEGKAIAAQLRGAKLYLEGDATKQHITSIAGPKILHVATHGFFLGNALETAGASGNESVERASPLLRSGLAFSGANARGESRAAGVLTALEASGLDLEGTKLVVLSACETGLGRIRSGEGVEGLRRALVLAGAETTVMSLWRVDDAATRDMMIAYYRRLESGEGRSEALRQVRLEMLANAQTAHPFYWASFIMAGDPSRLDGIMPNALPKVLPGQRGCTCALAGDPEGDEWGEFALLWLVGGAAWGWRRRRGWA